MTDQPVDLPVEEVESEEATAEPDDHEVPERRTAEVETAVER